MTVRNLFLSHFSITAEYGQVEFSPDFVPPWLAFRIDNQGTGIGRAAWSTGDESQYQTSAFTIIKTDGASNQATWPEPIKIPNTVLESITLPLENLVLPANGPMIMSLDITETDRAGE